MKCSLCGYIFNEENADKACKGCIIAKRCNMVKCPNCGYEMLPDPKWVKRLKNKEKGKNEAH